MKGKFFNCLLACCVLLVSNFCLAESAGENNSEKSASSQKYRVAVIIGLTGQVASLGNYLRKGIELGILELPAEAKSQLEFVFEDDQFDPKQTISSYQQLSSRGKVDAVIVMASPPANALAPIVEKKEQILIAVGASDPSIVKNRKNSFIHWVTPPVLGQKIALEIQRRNFSRLAFVTGEVTGAMADRDAAIEALGKLGLGSKIVYNETFPKDQFDYKTEIATIRAKQADLVVLCLFPGALSSFAKQAKQAGLTAEISGMETFEDDAEVKAAQGALLNTWYVNATDATEEFIDKYKKAYGESPGWAAANAYDTVRLISDGVVKHSGKYSAIRDHLATVSEFDGAAGKYSASGDNRFTLPAALKKVTADGFEALK